MKKISRRSFLMATGTFAAATALTACSGGGSTGKAIPPLPAQQLRQLLRLLTPASTK